MNIYRKADWPDIAIAAVLIGASLQIPSAADYVALWLIAGGITVILDALHCRNVVVARNDETSGGCTVMKTINLNIPKSAAERAAKDGGLGPEYVARMRSHVDEGGQLSHKNGLDLLTEVERLQALVPVYLGGTRT